MTRHIFLLLWATACVAVADDPLSARRDQEWHQWRGPRANGVAPQGDPPVTWSESENVRWKAALPGEGSATPIVWGERVFVLAAIQTDRRAETPPVADPRAKTTPPPFFYQFVALCLDRDTGAERWRTVLSETVPHEGQHGTNTYASGSPTTDGRRLYVSFGSRGVYALDLDGRLLWKRELGRMRTRYGWGEASTPAVHGERLIVNWDHEDPGFLAVLDAGTGETVWKADRNEPTSWATPLVVEHSGKTQVIVNATQRVRSYDLVTGEVLWQCGGQTVNAIPTPIQVGDAVVCMSGYTGAAAVSVPLGATGDLTGSDKLLWSLKQGTPYVPSPVLVGGQLYFTRGNTSVLTSLDAKTGQTVFGPERLPGLENVYASPVAAGDRIYFVGRNGTTTVLRAGKRLEVLATNKLDAPLDASPAIVGRRLFLRSNRHVYCLEPGK